MRRTSVGDVFRRMIVSGCEEYVPGADGESPDGVRRTDPHASPVRRHTGPELTVGETVVAILAGRERARAR